MSAKDVEDSRKHFVVEILRFYVFTLSQKKYDHYLDTAWMNKP